MTTEHLTPIVLANPAPPVVLTAILLGTPEIREGVERFANPIDDIFAAWVNLCPSENTRRRACADIEDFRRSSGSIEWPPHAGTLLG